MSRTEIIKFCVLVALITFGAGFIWGVATHRSNDAAVRFAADNIRTDLDKMLLIFSCNRERPLIAYDLLSGEVLRDANAINDRIASPPSVILNSPLFSNLTATAITAGGGILSIKDEFKAWQSERAIPRILAIIAVGMPSTYAGYRASEVFSLECSSSRLYDTLLNKQWWSPHILIAAKLMFDAAASCIEREVTLIDSDFFYSTDLNNFSDAVREWRQFIKAVTTSVPNKEILIQRYQARTARNPRTGSEDVAWGDSIYSSIYGRFRLQRTESDLNRFDFEAMHAANQTCSLLDRQMVNLYYRRIFERLDVGLLRISEQQFFNNLQDQIASLNRR